jgi:hypothetical protein
MRYTLRRETDGWKIIELVIRDDRPCSDTYADARDEDLVQIFRELRLLRAAGMPPDQHKGNPDVQVWSKQCKNEHQKTKFFVLKIKPSGWRLYFMVPDHQHHRIIFLYAVQKKKHARNQEDFETLCRYRRTLASGRNDVRLEPLYIPDR